MDSYLLILEITSAHTIYAKVKPLIPAFGIVACRAGIVIDALDKSMLRLTAPPGSAA